MNILSVKDKMKKGTLGFLIYFILLLLFIAYLWVKFSIEDSGADDTAGLYALLLISVTIYYFIFAFWTFKIFISNFSNLKSSGIQMVIIFLFGILSSLCILIKIY